MKGLLTSFTLTVLGLAPAPALAQSPQPADKTAPAEPAKIRRAETIVDDNWTVTCALTDQSGAKKQCSAVLRIAQAEKNGAQRIVFSGCSAVRTASSNPSLGPFRGVDSAGGGGQDRREGDAEALYSVCQPDHCESVLPLDEVMVKGLSAASTTEVSIGLVNGASAKFTVNMKGFSQALADLGK